MKIIEIECYNCGKEKLVPQNKYKFGLKKGQTKWYCSGRCAKIGKNNPMFGKGYTRLGNKNPMFGKPSSEKHREANRKRSLKPCLRCGEYHSFSLAQRYCNNCRKEIRKEGKLQYQREHKLIHNLRGRIYKLLKKEHKINHTIELIGCNIEYLKNYLKIQFKEGMNWENYGQWHIDHIRPCSSFDLANLEQQKECFNYKNLQPLWAEDNLKKHNKW